MMGALVSLFKLLFLLGYLLYYGLGHLIQFITHLSNATLKCTTDDA